MRFARWQLAVATIVAVCFSAAGCGGGSDSGTTEGTGSDSGTTTLRVAGNSNASALPLWVAMNQKILDKHNLAVKFTKIENVATLPPALDKSFDIVFTTPTLALASTAQGIPVTEIAGSSVDSKANPSSFLMVGKDSGIKDIKDLKGKKIGVLNETGTLHIATMYWLKQNGVAADSVSVVQVDGPAQADQLKSGRVDAVETVKPFSGQIEAVGGTSIGTPYFSLADSISPIYWAAGREWAEGHSDVVKRFQESLAEAVKFIAANDEQARKVLQQQTGFPAAVVKSFELPSYDASVRPEDVQKWLTAMREVNGFKGKVDVDKLTFSP
jgi:NitT/TauT family transport system substrate-binding protein